jgi:glycosyltransferase involved in cell wall biosynthesis
MVSFRHLHFVQSLEPLEGGGLGTASLQLHAELARQGCSRLFATRAEGFKTDWEGATQCSRRGPTPLFFSPALLADARGAVMRADWVHSHGLHVFPNWVFGREARRQGKPVAYHLHGMFDPWIRARSRKKKRVVGWLFENQNLAEARMFRALTSKEADQIRAAGIKGPIVTIPNGIDLIEADEARAGYLTNLLELQPRKRPRRVLFLSRLHPKKGLDLLIPVWGRLAAQFPDWEVAIVGPDEGGYQKSLERMILECGVGDSCFIFPAVSGPLKHALIHDADLFVLPSYSEGFPMAALEAAAHRRAMILSSECNIPELTSEGGAWLCQPELPSLEIALKKALSTSDTERAQRGELGRVLIERRFSWKQVAADLEAACKAYF